MGRTHDATTIAYARRGLSLTLLLLSGRTLRLLHAGALTATPQQCANSIRRASERGRWHALAGRRPSMQLADDRRYHVADYLWILTRGGCELAQGDNPGETCVHVVIDHHSDQLLRCVHKAWLCPWRELHEVFSRLQLDDIHPIVHCIREALDRAKIAFCTTAIKAFAQDNDR